MNMDTGSIAMLAIAATLFVGLIGVIVSIFATSNATHRRIDDFRTDTSRRFDDVDRRFADVDRRFADVDGRFADMDGRFADMDQQFVTLRTDMDRRFSDMDRHLGDLRGDFRDLRGRVDHIADSLSLGRPRTRKRA